MGLSLAESVFVLVSITIDEDSNQEASPLAVEGLAGNPVRQVGHTPYKIGNFTKTMPHNSIGEVDPAAYSAFINGASEREFRRHRGRS